MGSNWLISIVDKVGFQPHTGFMDTKCKHPVLLAQWQAYAEKRGWALTTRGSQALNDTFFGRRVGKGRHVRPEVRARMLKFMRDNAPALRKAGK